MNNSIKRILAIVLTVVMLAGCLAGCNQGEPEQTKNTTAGTVDTQAPTESTGKVIHDEPIEITILTTRHSNATNDANDVWFFQYLETWLAEQGYTNVTINASQTDSYNDQIALLLGTDSLPDLVWGCNLSEANAVVYGAGEDMILDWTPYLNEQTMPNFMSMFDDGLKSAITCTDGAIYALPYLNHDTSTGDAVSDFGMQDRMFINTEWLKAVGKEMPTNIDELLDVLRAFKEMKLESGEEVVPLVNASSFLQKWIFGSLGYYGATITAGTICIKDGKVSVPAYGDDYATYCTLLNTMYSEGLLSPDFFTMNSTTARGLATAGRCGVYCDYTLAYVPAEEFKNWVSVPFMELNGNTEHHISLDAYYDRSHEMWASSATEYPELIAMIVDYVYSTEGAMMYRYGPKKGEDPLGQQEGWYLDANGNITCAKVEDGTYASMELFARQEIYTTDYAGCALPKSVIWEACGYQGEFKTVERVDSITGETFEVFDYGTFSDLNNADSWWRYTNGETSTPLVTRVRLPGAFLSEDNTERVAELKTLITEYISSQSAAFISGQRPLAELDKFQEELKGLGVEEWLEIYAEAYAPYLQTIFG